MAVAMPAGAWIRWFAEIGIEDVPFVGGKNVSLGEMYRGLASKGIKVPNGHGGGVLALPERGEARCDLLSHLNLEGRS